MTTPLDDTAHLLSHSALGRGMPVGAVRDLAAHITVIERAQGDEICAEGAPATSLFLIARGIVKLVRALESGREVIVELLGRGDLFGESALADGGSYDSRATCVHPSTVLAIPRAAALELMSAHPQAVRNLLAVMNDSVLRAHRRVEDLAVFGVRQRIARFLIRLADWAGRAEQGRTVLPVALSRQDLASLVGTTTETTIRVMSGLRRDGLVMPARRGIVLPDRDALEAVARNDG